jgi:quinohemoprotein amine dehydrogenase alpha subunit-like protein
MALRLGMTPYFVALGACLAFAAGCSGSDGADGKDGAPGATGDTGPAGDPGDPGTPGQNASSSPSVSAVTPYRVFLDRTKTVTISGFGTEWTTDDTPTVSFGDNVAVDSVTVASPTALVVTISVDADATLGARDVTVTAGSDSLTYATGFMVESPLSLNLVGTAAQGSIIVGDVTNHDVENPFDTTHVGDGLFSQIVYTNVQVSALAGINGQVDTVDVFGLGLVLFADVDAAAGSKNLELLSGPDSNQTRFAYPAAFDLEARTAEAMTVGTPVTGSIADMYGSALYQLEGSTASAQLVTVEATSGESDAQPAFMLLPASGHFTDMIDYTAGIDMITEPAGSTFYLVYWDNTGAFGYDFELAASGIDIALGTDTEPNNTIAQAIDATMMPFAMVGASIPSLTDEDWIKYEATDTDVGKAFHMVTSAGDPTCDTVVAAYGSDGTTLLGDESPNMDYHEDHMSGPITAAGTYYIRISADQTGYYDPSQSVYDLLVTLEAP